MSVVEGFYETWLLLFLKSYIDDIRISNGSEVLLRDIALHFLRHFVLTRGAGRDLRPVTVFRVASRSICDQLPKKNHLGADRSEGCEHVVRAHK